MKKGMDRELSYSDLVNVVYRLVNSGTLTNKNLENYANDEFLWDLLQELVGRFHILPREKEVSNARNL